MTGMPPVVLETCYYLFGTVWLGRGRGVGFVQVRWV